VVAAHDLRIRLLFMHRLKHAQTEHLAFFPCFNCSDKRGVSSSSTTDGRRVDFRPFSADFVETKQKTMLTSLTWNKTM
jgi:hypothetical protein